MRSITPTTLALVLAMLSGCSGLRPFFARDANTVSATLPTQHELKAGQLVFRSDFVVPGGHRLVRELTAERDDICQALSMPCSDEPITVYLFQDAKAYSEGVNRFFPGVPSRRAFFVETDTQLAVYAHWSDRVAEDLRHEVAHGYLHAVAPGLPLWLDEGLAEYFEVPRGRGGLNQPHLDLLVDLARHNGWRPDLARLERISDISQMDQTSYAESWAWAHLLLESGPGYREVLTAYLFDVRSRGRLAESLSSRLQKKHADLPQLLMDVLLRAAGH
jgi:hypothetical protein